ncbi:MAG TPA: hypothetical protein VFY71_12850 [Planctomycetota bacterium]|nr:hypothetical protein [Planctomycetota bacterium]
MQTIRALLFTALATAVVAASSAAQGAVHIVDVTDPSALSWQEALSVAADGDVILLRKPSHAGGTHILGKSLQVVADTGYEPVLGSGETCDITGQEITIGALAPGQRVVLRGVEVQGLFLSNCDGQVWVEDSLVYDEQPALRAMYCADLVLHDVEIQGMYQSVYDMYGTCWVGVGLDLFDTSAVLHDVKATGGDGLSLTYSSDLGAYMYTSGLHGIQIQGGSLWLSGGVLQGGNGGNGGLDTQWNQCIPGMDAGHGLLLQAGSPQVMLRGVTAAGGAAGVYVGSTDCSSGSTADGAPGFGVQVSSGAVQELSGTPIQLHVASPVREQQVLTASVSGPAGLPVILLASPTFGKLSLVAVSGPLLTGIPQLVLPLGPLPASGTLSLQAAVPELGAGLQFASWTLQVISIEGGQRIAGPATSLLLLDSGL